MAAKLTTTATPGIYRRHATDCVRGARCECPYVVVWRHRGRQHTETFRTIAEAREAKGGRDAGERRASSKQKLSEYAAAWLEVYQGRTARGIGDGTLSEYRRAIDTYVVPFFDGFRLCDIEQPDVRRFVVSLQESGLSVGSVRKYIAPLKAMLATAVEDGALPANPAQGVRINARRDAQDAPTVKAKALTGGELAAILGALDERWRLPFELLAHTGLRISELLGLDWEDLKFGAHPRLQVRRQYYRGTLKATPKTDAGARTIPLSPGMARKLWQARPAHATGPMFRTRTGARMFEANLRRVLDGVTHDRVLEPGRRRRERVVIPAAAGPRLEWVSFHTFRHTCASMLIESGKNIRQVAGWLGHADPSLSLRVYAHLIDDGLGDAAFLDARVNTGSTQRQEIAANPSTAEKEEIAI
jgi:integrase